MWAEMTLLSLIQSNTAAMQPSRMCTATGRTLQVIQRIRLRTRVAQDTWKEFSFLKLCPICQACDVCPKAFQNMTPINPCPHSHFGYLPAIVMRFLWPSWLVKIAPSFSLISQSHILNERYGKVLNNKTFGAEKKMASSLLGPRIAGQVP